jgi:hypothetical protein
MGDFETFVEATRRRRETERLSRLHIDEEEETGVPANEPLFSVTAIARDRGSRYIASMIRFTWEEFQELHAEVGRAVLQKGRGRRRRLEPIDRFFVFILYLTSGFTYREVSNCTKLATTCVSRIVEACLRETTAILEARMPSDSADVTSEEAFENFPAVFGIVDASPVFINRPSRHQEQYYSGKFKRHCVKVQALVTPDGLCVHLSRVFRGRTHDKAIFDQSWISGFLIDAGEDGRDRRKLIMGDLGYVGIQKSGVRALLPHKRGRGQDLTEEQKEENRKLSHDRILVENFFGRWKSLFGICQGRYRGDLKNLSQIIRSTIIMTNWYILRHPLRQPDGPEHEEPSDDQDEPAGRAVLLDTDSSDDG